MTAAPVIDLTAERHGREAREMLDALARTADELAEKARDPNAQRTVRADRLFGMDVLPLALVWYKARVAFLEAEHVRHAVRERTGIDIAEDTDAAGFPSHGRRR
ncbi:MAG: hypothetical protein F4X99_19215 [Gammaproteobacteria bacterium]|nr:hypothetical protein [Gammaproteobacteria bacterium]